MEVRWERCTLRSCEGGQMEGQEHFMLTPGSVRLPQIRAVRGLDPLRPLRELLVTPGPQNMLHDGVALLSSAQAPPKATWAERPRNAH